MNNFSKPLSDGQKEILAGIPAISQQAFAACLGQREAKFDETDLSYSLNMVQTHASILCHEAEQWKSRALVAEEKLKELKLKNEQLLKISK